MTNEQTDVLAVIERMTADFQRGTIDAVMSAYERGAVVLFEPSVPVTDTEAIRQTFTEWMALKPKFTYSGHEVYVAGDLVVHIAPWSMTGTAPDGARRSTRMGYPLQSCAARVTEAGAWSSTILTARACWPRQPKPPKAAEQGSFGRGCPRARQRHDSGRCPSLPKMGDPHSPKAAPQRLAFEPRTGAQSRGGGPPSPT